VFALMAALMVEIPDFSTLGVLGIYGWTVLGLFMMALYSTLHYWWFC
jgi:hypothetical protein